MADPTASRLTLLAEEVRVYKIETEDRIKRLEDIVSAYTDPAPKPSDTPSKKSSE